MTQKITDDPISLLRTRPFEWYPVNIEGMPFVDSMNRIKSLSIGLAHLFGLIESSIAAKECDNKDLGISPQELAIFGMEIACMIGEEVERDFDMASTHGVARSAEFVARARGET